MDNKQFFDLLEELRAGIEKLDQTSFLQPDYSVVIDPCEKILKECGFAVRKPYVFTKKLNNLNDLIHLFHELYKKHFPDFIDLPLNVKKELSIASKLLQSRMDTAGLSKYYALQECGEIVRTVFENGDKFRLTPPFDFGVFGQDSLIWITNKAVHLMNERVIRYRILELEKQSDEMIEKLEAGGRKPGWSDERLNRALNIQKEKDNGKEANKKGRAG